MSSIVGSDLEARLDALAARIDGSLDRVRDLFEQPSRARAGDREALLAELRDAEARALLQAQRCVALEDRITGLEAALNDARAARPQAHAPRGPAELDATLAETLQAKLLEVERLSSELAELRRSNDEWRTRARNNRRELDGVSTKLERATAQVAELRAREESASRRVGELERLVAEQRRELETAERRTKHLRERMSSR